MVLSFLHLFQRTGTGSSRIPQYTEKTETHGSFKIQIQNQAYMGLGFRFRVLNKISKYCRQNDGLYKTKLIWV
jgi:hypothetical protein